MVGRFIIRGGGGQPFNSPHCWAVSFLILHEYFLFKGLQTTQNSRFYAISARFKPFSNKGKTLIIQYTVKHEQKMDCGGGYIKLFPADVDQKNLNGKSQYYIMFGEFR